MLFTPDDQSFEIGWVKVDDRKDISFEVNACKEAYVALTAYPGNKTWSTYQVLIGGWENSKSAIYDQQGRRVIQVDTKGIVNCNETRAFWVSWRDGAIAVGQGGMVDSNGFMKWSPKQLGAINAFQVYTGNGTKGRFKFIQGAGR